MKRNTEMAAGRLKLVCFAGPILVGCLQHLFAQQQFEVKPGGISSLYWPFANSQYVNSTTGTGNWTVTCGAGCGGHLGADYYADDWARFGGNEATCSQVVNSPMAGTVIFAGSNGEPGYGKQVVIRSSANQNFAFRVAHLDVISVSEGQEVSTGAKLGEIGRTGSATGCHAHCVLYKSLDQTYAPTGQPGLQRLQTGFGLGFTGSANHFAAAYYYNEAPPQTDESSLVILRLVWIGSVGGGA